MPTIDWKVAIQYAKLVELAESVAPTSDDSQLTAQLAALNYTFVATFFGNDIATDINQGQLQDPVSFGLLALSAAGELVVSIRGTATFLEWIQDARFGNVDSPVAGSTGKTEDGFTDLYNSLHMGTDPSTTPTLLAAIQTQLAGAAKTVTVCGHSLGGALTTLVAMDVALNSTCKDPVVYSFASPRVGDPTFSQQYDSVVPNTFRVANRFDIVPQLPPPGPFIPYEHVKTLFEVVPSLFEVKFDLGCMHHLATYMFLMAKKAGIGGFQLPAGCHV